MANVFGASFRGRADKLQKYLKVEDPSLVHCPGVHFVDGAGNSPLHAACQEGHAACVEILLHAGADFDKLGAGGLPPLMVACEYGRSYCAQLLLEAKANASFAAITRGGSQPGLPGVTNGNAFDAAVSRRGIGNAHSAVHTPLPISAEERLQSC